MRSRSVWMALVGLLVASLAAGSGAAAATCAGAAPGGEWRSYGGSLSNARSQPEEGVINPSTVANLGPAWVFRSTNPAPAGVGPTGGGFSNTPVVADGCVYLASNTGWVIALNANNGALVWGTKLGGQGQTLLGGVIVGSPVVPGNGAVYVGVSRPPTPYVTALDQATGRVLWTSVIENQALSAINASPVYFDGMIFQGFFGNEGTADARGGFAIVDASPACPDDPAIPAFDPAATPFPQRTCSNRLAGATGGAVMAHTYTITDAEYAAGYRGAGVWCTPAVDPVSKHAFACGGNPASKRLEARYSNALLKIDMDKTNGRGTFGEIVRAYKGNVDQYYPGLDRQPACELFPGIQYVAWSATCLQLDLDFGASPNLFQITIGSGSSIEVRTVLGALQKSGVYHVVWADNMQYAWTTVIAPPCFFCNATSSAFDATQVYAVGSPPGQMVAMARENGKYRWAGPIGDVIHYQSVATANGVVYTMDTAAALNAFDAATGLILLRRPMSADTGTVVADAGSAGVSIARNTLYAASGQFVIAYR